MKRPKINAFTYNLTSLFSLYLLVLLGIGCVIWILLSIALPEGAENLQNVLFTTLALKVPKSLLSEHSEMTFLIIAFFIVILTVCLILVDIYFKAIVTAKLINPPIDLVTSSRGVLSTKWDAKKAYILVRLVNFNKAELVNVEVKAVVTVTETIKVDNGETSTFSCYFPVTDIDPTSVLILQSRMPWSIAVPANIRLENSINHGYELNVGKKIEQGILPDREIILTERKIEFLISGVEPSSSSFFAIHRSVDLDRQEEGKYELLLHEGTFKDLPMHVLNRDDVEEYRD